MHRVVDSTEMLADCQASDLMVDGMFRDYLRATLLRLTNRAVGKTIPLGAGAEYNDSQVFIFD